MTLSINKMTAIITAAVLAVLLMLAVPSFVSAQNTDAACQGVAIAGGTCDATAGNDGISNVIKTIINVLSIIVGAISVIMIIIGGLRYVVSAGDSSATAGAKNTIIYALVGLVVVIFAQAIVAFVIGSIE